LKIVTGKHRKNSLKLKDMKKISTVVVMMALICHTKFYSQKYSKEYNLKVMVLNTVEKNEKTICTVKTILTNHSRDTLFYFSLADYELAFYRVQKVYRKKDMRNDTLIDDGNSFSLDLDFEKRDAAKQTVIWVPPSGQRTINFEIKSYEPLISKIELIFFLSVYKSKNLSERISQNDLIQKKERKIVVKSNIIKVKPKK
jgi:hypothetical protein